MIRNVETECNRAGMKYGAFLSTHEGYGVLAEEVAELLDAIRANDRGAIELEAIQVAAVACRIANAVRSSESEFMERSGLTG